MFPRSLPWFRLCLAPFYLVLLGTAGAATVTVTRLDDRNVGCNAGDCSLREAVGLANTMAGDDTITFSIPIPAGITLGNGDIGVTPHNSSNGPRGYAPPGAGNKINPNFFT